MSDSILHELVKAFPGTTFGNLPQNNFDPVHVSSTVSYVIVVGELDGVDNRVWYEKTIDGGVTWTTAEIAAGVDHNGSWKIWSDTWTQGDAGTLIHIALVDSEVDDVLYWNLDTSDDSITGPVVVNTQPSSLANTVSVGIVKTRGGNLDIQWKVGTSHGMDRSTNGGVSWGPVTSGAEGQTHDHFVLQPGNETDPQDFWMFFYDDSNLELSLKVYDDSLNSFSETSIVTSVDIPNPANWYQFGVAPRFSDNNSVVAIWSDLNVATADLRIFDVGGASSITELTALETNLDGATNASVVIDQNNDDIYVVYLVTSLEAGKDTDIVYKLSSNGGTTWGSRVIVNDSEGSDALWVFAGMSINATPIRPVWVMPIISRVVIGVTAAVDVIGTSAQTSAIPTVESISYRINSDLETTAVERPRGCLIDDFLLMFVQLNTDGAAVVLDVPDGWNLIHRHPSNSSTQKNAAMICWRFVESGEADTYTVTCNLSGRMTNVAILRISNVGPDPIHAFELDSTQSPDVPAITTILPNCLILRGGLMGEGAISSIPTGHTHIYGGGVGDSEIRVLTIAAPTPTTLALEDIIGGIAPDADGYSLALLGGHTGLVQISVEYIPLFGGAAVNLDFDLKITEFREKIETNALALNTPGLENLPLALNYAKMTITLKGTAVLTHASHPVLAGHIPDIIDLEEMAILWNRDVLTRMITVTLPLVSGRRTYRGLINRMTIVENPGTGLVDVIVVFMVAWNIGVPAFRGWV